MALMTNQQAFKFYNGKPVDVDNFPKGQKYQCYDWFAKFIQRTRGYPGNPLCRPSGGVKDIFYNFDNIKNANGVKLNKYYRRVVNNPLNSNQLPPQGAIIIWSGSQPGSGGYGHIGVVYHAYRSYFVSFDQNWGGAYVHPVSHNWSYILGWLVHK